MAVTERQRGWSDRAIRWTTTASVIVLAGIAAALSYKHMYILVRQYGETSWAAALLPVSVDGVIAVSSMTLLADSRQGRRSGFLPWALLVTGSAASLAANVAVAEPSLVGRLIAAWPSAALIGSYGLLMRQVRHSAVAGRAARGETGRLRVGFIASALLDPLPVVLGRFGRERPDVRLELNEMATSRSTAALVAGELDVAITLGPPRGAGTERLVSVPIAQDHLIAVVSTAHPFAGQPSVSVDQLRRQPLIVAPGEDEPTVIAGLRTLLGEDSTALAAATVARDIHTIMGLAASGVGVGLGPSRMLAAPRPGTWFCEVTPRTPLPDLVLSFAARDRSPVLSAFLDTIRNNCPGVGAALDHRLGPRPTDLTQR